PSTNAMAKYHNPTVKSDNGMPNPIIMEASLGFSPWFVARMAPVIIGAMADSRTQTWAVKSVWFRIPKYREAKNTGISSNLNASPSVKNLQCLLLASNCRRNPTAISASGVTVSARRFHKYWADSGKSTLASNNNKPIPNAIKGGNLKTRFTMVAVENFWRE